MGSFGISVGTNEYLWDVLEHNSQNIRNLVYFSDVIHREWILCSCRTDVAAEPSEFISKSNPGGYQGQRISYKVLTRLLKE